MLQKESIKQDQIKTEEISLLKKKLSESHLTLTSNEKINRSKEAETESYIESLHSKIRQNDKNVMTLNLL